MRGGALGPVPASGKGFDDLDDLLAPEAVVACEFDEIPGAGENRTALGRAGHRDAAPAPKLQQAFLPEHMQRAKDGVLVHAQHGREVLARGSRSPGPASPSAMARRICAATWSWSGMGPARSMLTSSMVLVIVVP